MQRNSGGPAWPAIGMLVVLFALSITAPVRWNKPLPAQRKVSAKVYGEPTLAAPRAVAKKQGEPTLAPPRPTEKKFGEPTLAAPRAVAKKQGEPTVAPPRPAGKKFGEPTLAPPRAVAKTQGEPTLAPPRPTPTQTPVSTPPSRLTPVAEIDLGLIEKIAGLFVMRPEEPAWRPSRFDNPAPPAEHALDLVVRDANDGWRRLLVSLMPELSLIGDEGHDAISAAMASVANDFVLNLAPIGASASAELLAQQGIERLPVVEHEAAATVEIHRLTMLPFAPLFAGVWPLFEQTLAQQPDLLASRDLADETWGEPVSLLHWLEYLECDDTFGGWSAQTLSAIARVTDNSYAASDPQRAEALAALRHLQRELIALLQLHGDHWLATYARGAQDDLAVQLPQWEQRLARQQGRTRTANDAIRGGLR